MARVIAPTSNDKELEQLLRDVQNNTMQLPEFQRSWIWDDKRIRALIASISQGYPMGVIMLLEYSDNLRFHYRSVEGTEANGQKPTFLILDGQQRITSIYCSAHSKEPVLIHNPSTGKDTKRYYYLDINKCLDPGAERIDAIVSYPEDRKLKGKATDGLPKDLSTRESEYEHEMFPLNIIFDSGAKEDWGDNYKEYHGDTRECREKYKRFRTEVLDTITSYRLPVITLLKDTPTEAVRKVFENVNTGGVVLTVFELLTALYAADFNLREDWEKCREVITGRTSGLNTDLMDDVDNVSFLTAITLYAAYTKKRSIKASMNERILHLPLDDYKASRDAVLEGYEMARSFLFSQCVFRKKHLPYGPQVTVLATICAIIGRTQFDKGSTKSLLSRWFWCGVLGEMYGNLTFSSYTNDIEDIPAAIAGTSSRIRTIDAAFFSATRLITLTGGTGAAYKGIMALMYKKGCADLADGSRMDVVLSMSETPDIHHIFPKSYCEDKHIPKSRYNSAINKTPLLASSNKFIGKDAPSVYSRRIIQETHITEQEFRARAESNFIDYDMFMADDFDGFFIDRARRLLVLIEQVMGKPITDKASAQTIELYGESLA